MTQEPNHLPDDEFRWLEDIYGEKPLDWVRDQNARTQAKLVDEKFLELEQNVLEILDSEDRIPAVTKRGNFYYNFWRDKTNPRGLWRRATWESYLQDSPEWDVLLDVDALAAAEGTDWVFAGSQFLRPADGTSSGARCCGSPPTAGTRSRCASSTSKPAASWTAVSGLPLPRPTPAGWTKTPSCSERTSAPAA